MASGNQSAGFDVWRDPWRRRKSVSYVKEEEEEGKAAIAIGTPIKYKKIYIEVSQHSALSPHSLSDSLLESDDS